MGVGSFVAGVAVGAAAASGAMLWSTKREVALLQGLDVRVSDPGVPDNVLAAVRGAEMKAYREMSTPRKAIEDGQDIAALIWPQAVYRRNYSVGAYRIKSQTAAALVEYAVQRGLLSMRVDREAHYSRILPVLAQQPALNSWCAAVLLSQLREQHPLLRERSWADIAADGDAIAKLYSGYTGAGGHWDLWAADSTPGPVARARLGYDEATGTYAGIEVATADRAGAS